MSAAPQPLDEVVLKPGDSINFADRDDLLAKLDRLNRPVPGRNAGRTRDQREHFSMRRYLRLLAGEADALPLPVTLRKPRQDPPDFVLEWPDGRSESFELTDGSTTEYQRRLSEAARQGDEAEFPLFPAGITMRSQDPEVTERWVEILFASFLRKAQALRAGRFSIDHLLLYDLTGLGLLLPLAEGRLRLREMLLEWHREEPEHRFTRISVLRDQALLLDITGEAKILQAESPYYRLWMVEARDEEDLARRLREIDRYCRNHGISHLKLFGSILRDRTDEPDEGPEPHDFRPDSDLDLLVEFEPGKVVTLFDMSRMERELTELIGFKVDLRTAGDLSRYFRQDVLDRAVELHAEHA